jgi:tetratricopeptide (TPR) repeat protein
MPLTDAQTWGFFVSSRLRGKACPQNPPRRREGAKNHYLVPGFLLAWSCWSVLVTAQTNPKQSGNLLDDGIKLLGEGHFLEAVDILNRFKETAPSDPRPYFYSGIALTEAGRLSAAAQELGEAVRLEPQRPEYRIFQANVLSRLRQKSHAIDALTILDKNGAAKQLDSAWLLLLSEVYSRLERYEDALKTLELLSERTPTDPRIDLSRGKVYLEMGESDLALASFQKSIRRSPNNSESYFELGKILYQRNELAASKRAFLEAVKRDSQDAEYLLKLGQACLALDQVDEALEYLKRAGPAASSHPQILYALGNAYQRSGDRAKAVEYRKRYQEVSLARRQSEDVEREVGKLLKEAEKHLDQGNTAAANAVFEKVLRLDPNNWDAHGYLAEGFLSSGELRLAYEHLVKMAEVDPDSVVGNYLLAKYWYQTKDFEQARAYAEKVRSFRPGHAELRNLLGHIYLGLGRQESALREFEAAVQLAPDRSDFRENLLKIKNRTPQR